MAEEENNLKSFSARIRDRISNETLNSAKDSIQGANKAIVSNISKITIDPLKQAISPQGIGLMASRALGNSPLVGTVVEGSLNKIVNSIGGFAKIIREESKEDQTKANQEILSDIKNQIDTFDGNEEVKNLLMELIKIGELSLSIEQRAVLEKERTELKNIETQRELSKTQEKQLDLFEDIAEAIEKTNGKKEKKDSIFESIAKFRLGEILTKGISGGVLFGGIATFFNKGLPKLLSNSFKLGFVALPKMIAKAALFGLKFVFTPIAFLKAFTEGFKSFKRGGSIEEIMSSAITGFFSIFTAGLIDTKKAKEILTGIFDKITDFIGNAIFQIATVDFKKIFETISKTFKKLGEDSIKIFSDGMKVFAEDLTQIFKELEGILGKFARFIPGFKGRHMEREELKKIKSVLEKGLFDIENEKQLIKNNENLTAKQKQSALFALNKRKTNIKTRLAKADTRLNELSVGNVDVVPFKESDLKTQTSTPAAIGKSIEFIQAQKQNTLLKDSVVAGRQSSNVIAPVTNNVVTQQQATPYIAPKNKRNNENTFQRMSDLNNNAKLI